MADDNDFLIIEMPLGGGVDQYTDTKFVLPGRLDTLENARYDKPPGMNKRFGYTLLSKSIISGTNITNGIRLDAHNPSGQNRLLLFAGNRLYEYAPTIGSWSNFSEVCPGLISRDHVYGDLANSYSFGDAAYNMGYNAYTIGPHFLIRDSGGQIVKILNGTDKSARVIAVGNFFFYFNIQVGTIAWVRVDLTSGTLAHVSGTLTPTVANDLWDVSAVEGATNRFLLAYKDGGGANHLKLELYNTLNPPVLQGSSQDVGYVPLDCISVRGTLDEQAWVASGGVSPTAGPRARPYALTSTSLSATTADFSLITETVLKVLSITSARLDSTHEAFAWSVSYTQPAAPPTAKYPLTRWCTGDTSGTSSGAVGSSYVKGYMLTTRLFKDSSGNTFAGVMFDDTLKEQGTGCLIRIGSSPSTLDTRMFWVGTYARNVANEPSIDHTANNSYVSSVAKTVGDNFFWAGPVRTKIFSTDSGTGLIPSTFQAIDSFSLSLDDSQRFMGAAWGQSRFICGSLPTWYDGLLVVEHGFAQWPVLALNDMSFVGGGSLTAGNYQIVKAYKYMDANGFLFYSFPSAQRQVTAIGSQKLKVYNQVNETLEYGASSGGMTNRTNGNRLELYRSDTNGVSIYRATAWGGTDPAAVSNDLDADSNLTSNDVLYITDDILGNITPSSCKYVVRHKDRLFIGGMESAGEVWFSQPFNYPDAPRFNDTLKLLFDFPVTGLATLDDKLVVFGVDRIYVVYGDGPSARGGLDLGYVQIRVPSDVGCIQSGSIVTTPMGVFFRSLKGIHLLTRSLDVHFVGKPVKRLIDAAPTLVSATLLQSKNEVRFATSAAGESGQLFVYDYVNDSWCVDTLPAAPVSATMYGSTYCWLDATGQVYQENSGFTDGASGFVKMKLVTPWIGQGSIRQAWQELLEITVLGKYKSQHTLRIRVGYDYNESDWPDDRTFSTAEIDAMSTATKHYQLSLTPGRQTCEAFRVWIEDGAGAVPGEGPELASLLFKVRGRGDSFKLRAADSG